MLKNQNQNKQSQGDKSFRHGWYAGPGFWMASVAVYLGIALLSFVTYMLTGLSLLDMLGIF